MTGGSNGRAGGGASISRINSATGAVGNVGGLGSTSQSPVPRDVLHHHRLRYSRRKTEVGCKKKYAFLSRACFPKNNDMY